jgi:AraC-like DNA-binding protein
MKYIFLIAAFNAFFFTALMFQKKPRALHDNILSLWLIYLGLFIGVYALYSHELFTRFRLLSVVLISLLMLHGPFLYEYVLALVTVKNRLRAKDFLHLLPFVLFVLYILSASLNPEMSSRLNLENVSPGNNPPLLFTAFLVLTSLSGTAYFILTLMLFKKLSLNIFNNYSNPAGVDPQWIRMLAIVFGIVWTALITVTVIHHIFGMFSIVFCTDGLFLSLSVFVITIGWFGLRQKIIFPPESTVAVTGSGEDQARYAGSRLTAGDARSYAARITEHMEASKPYLEPDLSLPQLAGSLGMPVHYLSQVINEQFGINFHDFVNRYRVEAFKEKLGSRGFENYTLLGIAFECGFNSKSAFNRVFRQFTGVTPSQYKRTL